MKTPITTTVVDPPIVNHNFPVPEVPRKPETFKRPIVGSEFDTDLRARDVPRGPPKYAIMFANRIRRVTAEWPTELADRESVLEIPNVEFDWVGASVDDIAHLKGVRNARLRNAVAGVPIPEAPMPLTDADMPPTKPITGAGDLRAFSDGSADLTSVEDVMTDIMGGSGDARFRSRRILDRFAANGWRIVKTDGEAPAERVERERRDRETPAARADRHDEDTFVDNGSSAPTSPERDRLGRAGSLAGPVLPTRP